MNCFNKSGKTPKTGVFLAEIKIFPKSITWFHLQYDYYLDAAQTYAKFYAYSSHHYPVFEKKQLKMPIGRSYKTIQYHFADTTD